MPAASSQSRACSTAALTPPVTQKSPKSASSPKIVAPADVKRLREVCKSLEAAKSRFNNTTTGVIKDNVCSSIEIINSIISNLTNVTSIDDTILVSQETREPTNNAEIIASVTETMTAALASFASNFTSTFVTKIDALVSDVDAMKRAQETQALSLTKTFADAASRHPDPRQEHTTISKTSSRQVKKLAISQPKKTWSFVMKPDDDDVTQNDARNLFAKKIDLIAHKCPAPTVIPLSNRTTKYTFGDEASRDEIMKAVNHLTGLTAELPKSRRPTLILKGLIKGITDEELIEALISQNVAVRDAVGTEAPSGHVSLKIRQLNRSKNGESRLENVILETSNEVKDALIGMGRVNVSHQKVHVEERSNFLQCFKCFGFGHTVKHCKSTDDICSICSITGHRHEKCPSKDDDAVVSKCINCVKSNEKNKSSDATNHVAISRSCPIVKLMMKKANDRLRNV